MMGVRNGSPALRIVRWALTLGLAAAAAGVLYEAFRREPRFSRPSTAGPQPSDREIDRKEGIRHQEYQDGRVRADIRADRAYVGVDGLNHLEGAVEFVDHALGGGPETSIAADEVVYDREQTLFRISGHVRIRQGTFLLESPFFEYDKKAGVFRTDRGGTFASEDYSGSAREIVYSENLDEIKLSGDLRVEVVAPPPESGKAVITGGLMRIGRRERAGEVGRGAAFVHPRAAGESGLLRFRLAPTGRWLSEVELARAAKCAFEDPGRGRQTLAADTVRISFRSESARIARVESEGKSALALSSSAEPGLTVQADRSALGFDDGGHLNGLQALGKVQARLEKAPSEYWTIEAEEITYDPPSGRIVARGPEGGDATLESDGSRVEGAAIDLEAGTFLARASGGVKCLLKAGQDNRPPALFSGIGPVFVVCMNLEFRGEDGLYVFSGAARIWQARDSIRAGELEFLERDGTLRGRGAVTVGLSGPPKEGSPAGTFECGGDTFVHSPQDRALVFEGRAFVRTPDFRLTSDSLRIALRQVGGEVEHLSAEKTVAVKWRGYEGRGQAAEYDPDARTVVLTGGPVLADPGQGSTRGDKLTFHLADDRILIENGGQGRSVSVVKS